MIKIAYLGDLIFGDQPIKFGYGAYSQNLEFDFFADLKSNFNQYDYTIANFESVIKLMPKKMSISTWSMCTSKVVARRIREIGIKGISIANNHTMDYGKKWFDYTVKCLESENIDVFGKVEKPYKILNLCGKKIVIIAFSDLIVKYDDVPYYNKPDIVELFNLISQIKDVDYKIIYCHWGSEFVVKPTNEQLSRLNDLSALNIDAVVGHHAHVIQDKFIYKGMPVFLSLGNFISDYWQIRARKTEIIIQEIDSEVRWKSIPCLINEKSRPQIDNYEYLIDLPDYDNQLVTNEEINKERWQLRREYVRHILVNFFKVKNKIMLIKWLLRRFVYIIHNFKKEKKNPNIIYEKYEN